MKRAIEYLQAIIAVIWLLLLIVWLTGCAERIQYVTVPITRDPRPVLDKVKDKELECLTVEAHNKLFKQIMTLEHYAIELETTIDAHNGTPAGR